MGWSYIPTEVEAQAELRESLKREKRSGRPALDYEETYRSWARATCAICKKPLGRGTKFYGNPDAGTGEHALCVWKQAEKPAGADTLDSPDGTVRP